MKEMSIDITQMPIEIVREIEKICKINMCKCEKHNVYGPKWFGSISTKVKE
jgi:hypothetical protein